MFFNLAALMVLLPVAFACGGPGGPEGTVAITTEICTTKYGRHPTHLIPTYTTTTTFATGTRTERTEVTPTITGQCQKGWISLKLFRGRGAHDSHLPFAQFADIPVLQSLNLGQRSLNSVSTLL